MYQPPTILAMTGAGFGLLAAIVGGLALVAAGICLLAFIPRKDRS